MCESQTQNLQEVQGKNASSQDFASHLFQFCFTYEAS